MHLANLKQIRDAMCDNPSSSELCGCQLVCKHISECILLMGISRCQFALTWWSAVAHTPASCSALASDAQSPGTRPRNDVSTVGT